MKTILGTLLIVLAGFVPATGFPCSMAFGTRVVCGTIDAIGKSGDDRLVAIGVKSNADLTVGGRGAACDWVETLVPPSVDYLEVAELPEKDALKLRDKLVQAKHSQEEVCIFSTFALQPNYAFVDFRDGRSTQQVDRDGLEQFKNKIRKQLGE